ncbi:alpha/beta fold hydrolase [Streptomyces inhibens]|uniref:alpha/beta fold hydrolase n=1 Tax=Streptomyces inhibens TaxID=2293571 RepID=UPI00367B4C21
MQFKKFSSLAIGLGVVATFVTPTVAFGAAAQSGASEDVKWELCRDAAEDWNREDERSECALISVPLDYSKPEGRKIDIAVSRVKATGNRKGALFTNPGGPGIAGTPTPRELLESQMAPMNDEFDFIGIDTRGTGYSSSLTCDPVDIAPGTEEQEFEQIGAWNRKCIAKDPELATSISMENASRDMDRVREALGFDKINFYGNSGGSGLGAVYRSMFDDHVDRMWIESIMPPSLDDAAIAVDAQFEANYRKFFEWLAARDATYHFGNTSQEVEVTLTELKKKHGRDKVDQSLDVNLAEMPAKWERYAAKLVELKNGAGGEAVKSKSAPRSTFGIGKKKNNYVITHTAFMCNASTSGRDYSDVVKRREERKKKNPWGGNNKLDTDWVDCAGWPAGKPWELKPGKSQLQISGHEFEVVTPYPFAKLMQEKIGGSLLTIKDNAHSTIKSKKLACGSKLVDFFRNGTTTNDSCPGAPAEEAGPVGNLAGSVKLQNCSASLVRPSTARDEDKALLLTNGHCFPGERPKPGEVLVDKDVQIEGTVLSPAGRELGPVTGKRVLYATMTGTDAMLVQLDSTYADIDQKYKTKAFPLASSGPVAGQDIKVVSSYLESVWSCKAEAVVPTLKEGDYTSNMAIRYAKECNTQPGSSGSAVVDAKTGNLIAVNSTSNRDGKECELDNPCEVDSKGTVVHKGRGYATQTALIDACIGSGNVVDLKRPGCTLPKP